MKKALVAALLAVGLFSSCLGPDRLWNKLHDWNLKATENRWANEGIFLELAGAVPIPAGKRATPWDEVLQRTRAARARRAR